MRLGWEKSPRGKDQGGAVRGAHHQAEDEQDLVFYDDSVASSNLVISRLWAIRILLRTRSSAFGARILQRLPNSAGGNGSDMDDGNGTDD